MKRFIFLAAMLLALSCGNRTTNADTSGEAGIVVYHNGEIVTMAGDQPEYVEAVVVKEGRILFAGGKDEALKLAGDGAQQVDLEGKTMMPAFQDTHGHLLLKMHNLERLDCTGTKTVDEVLERFRKYIADKQIGKDQWALGYLIPKPQVLGRLLTKDDLDKVSTEVPIIAQESSGHIATMNSAALKKLNISAATKDPVGGTYRRYPGTKEPNGIFDEAAVISTYATLPPLPAEKVKTLLADVCNIWAKYGYTTSRELLAGLSGDDLLIARMAADSNWMPLDLILYANAPVARDAMKVFPDATGKYYNGIKLGGLKIMMDGVPNSYTAHMRKPYANVPPEYKKDFKGFPNTPVADVMKYVDEFYNTPMQINAHVMGDAAIDNFLKAIEAAQKKYGKLDKRQMAHHAGIVDPGLASRFKATDTWAVYNSAAVSGFGKSLEYYLGKDGAKYTMPARMLLDSGVNVTTSTDCPSGPTEPEVFKDIYGLVARKSWSGDYVNAPEQKISIYEGMLTATRWGAKGNFEENEKGTIEKGKQADLVILDRNPLKVETDELIKIQVLQTINDGKTIYKKQ